MAKQGSQDAAPVQRVVHRRWKQGQAMKEEFGDLFWARRDGTRKPNGNCS